MRISGRLRHGRVIKTTQNKLRVFPFGVHTTIPFAFSKSVVCHPVPEKHALEPTKKRTSKKQRNQYPNTAAPLVVFNHTQNRLVVHRLSSMTPRTVVHTRIAVSARTISNFCQQKRTIEVDRQISKLFNKRLPSSHNCFNRHISTAWKTHVFITTNIIQRIPIRLLRRSQTLGKITFLLL